MCVIYIIMCVSHVVSYSVIMCIYNVICITGYLMVKVAVSERV